MSVCNSQRVCNSPAVNMTYLLLIALLLQVKIKEAQLVLPLTKCQNALDLIFLLDGSQSVEQTNFNLVKNYTKNLISKFTIDPAHTRVGIVEFSTLARDVIKLGQYDNFQILAEAIEKIQKSNVGTSTHAAIALMRKMFQTNPRQGATKVGVCITDGLSISPNFTQVEAKKAQSENVSMFALGIGPNVFKTELKFIASKEEYVKEVSDYSALPTNLASEICSLNQGTTTPPLGTTPSGLIIDRINDTDQNGSPGSTTPSKNIINEGVVDANRQFLPHPSDCSKFLETEDASGLLAVHERNCPFGQLYSENALTCVDTKYSSCKYDICKNKTTAPMKDNCRGYWVCVNGDMKAVCCSAGTGYLEGVGCQPGVCDTPCPPVVASNNKTACNLMEVPHDDTVYLEFVLGHGNITRQCAPGTAFNQTSCGCSTYINIHTGIQGSTVSTPSCKTNLYLPFNKRPEDLSGTLDWSGMSTPMSCSNINVTDGANGKALFGPKDCFIYIWRFASVDLRNIQIKFQLTPLNGTANSQIEAILTNCYPLSWTCNPSLALLIDRFNMKIGIKLLTSSGNMEKTTNEWISYKTGKTNDVQIDISDTNVVFTVEGQSKIIFLDGQINIRQSGFAFGSGGAFTSFQGYLDEIRIVSC